MRIQIHGSNDRGDVGTVNAFRGENGNLGEDPTRRDRLMREALRILDSWRRALPTWSFWIEERK